MISSAKASVPGSAGSEPSTSSSQEDGAEGCLFCPFYLSPGTWEAPPHPLDQLLPLSSCSYSCQVPQHSREGKHLTPREGPSWRRTPSAGEVGAFIERFTCAAWSPTWHPKGLRPGGAFSPCDGGSDRGPTVGQDGRWLGPFSGGGSGERVGRPGGTCCGAEGTRGWDCPAEPFQGWFCLLCGRSVSASCHSGAQHQKVLRGQNREPS